MRGLASMVLGVATTVGAVFLWLLVEGMSKESLGRGLESEGGGGASPFGAVGCVGGLFAVVDLTGLALGAAALSREGARNRPALVGCCLCAAWLAAGGIVVFALRWWPRRNAAGSRDPHALPGRRMCRIASPTCMAPMCHHTTSARSVARCGRTGDSRTTSAAGFPCRPATAARGSSRPQSATARCVPRRTGSSGPCATTRTPRPAPAVQGRTGSRRS